MEIAICQLLLGRKTEAMGTLGVLEGAPDGADSAPDTGILDFIKVCCSAFTRPVTAGLHLPRQLMYGLQLQRMLLGEQNMSQRDVRRGCRHGGLQGHASGDGDLTPGLMAMAQSWVEDVALPSFRANGASMPPLDSWFESPQVKLYLMVRASPHSHSKHNMAAGALQPLFSPSMHHTGHLRDAADIGSVHQDVIETLHLHCDLAVMYKFLGYTKEGFHALNTTMRPGTLRAAWWF